MLICKVNGIKQMVLNVELSYTSGFIASSWYASFSAPASGNESS